MNNPKTRTAEFACRNPHCRSPVRFDLEMVEEGFAVSCAACGKREEFEPDLIEKFRLLRELIEAIRRAGPILADSRLVVESGAGRSELPFNLLFNRLTTDFALDFRGYDLDLRIAVSPLAAGYEEDGTDGKG